MASGRIFSLGRRFLGRGIRIGLVASVGATAGFYGGFMMAMKQSDGAVEYHGAQAALEVALDEMADKLLADMGKSKKEIGPGPIVVQTEEEQRLALQIARARAYIEAYNIKKSGFLLLLASDLLTIAKSLGDERVPQKKRDTFYANALVAIASSEMLLAGLSANPEASSFDIEKQGLATFIDSMDALRIHWSFGIRPSLAGLPIATDSDDNLQWIKFNDPLYVGLRTGKSLSAEEAQELLDPHKEKGPVNVSQIVKS